MKYIGKTKAYTLLFLVIVIATSFVIYRLEIAKNLQIELAKQKVVQNAVAHYFNLVVTRHWNARDNGVYVKQDNRNIKPNPYLKDNTLISKDNEVLIKINPAWMTRQISEIANELGDHYFKITSLNPLNPENAADEFEAEALHFFEKNKAEKYFYQFSPDYSNLDFMGVLKTKQQCLACHEHQGYKVGDIRGGIRISSPNDSFKKEIELLKLNALENNVMIIFSATLILLFLLRATKIIYTHQQDIEQLNQQLEKEKQLEHALNEELKQTQAYLIQAEKMSAIGQLAAGIAHEINNPLGYIYSNLNTLHQYSHEMGQFIDDAEKCMGRLDDSNADNIKCQKLKKELDIDFIREDLDDLIDESKEGVVKARTIIQNLLKFTGVDKLENQTVNIEEELNAITNILQNQFGERITMTKAFSNVKPFKCNPSQLNQLLMNLILNAIQSIKDTGEIQIKTAYKDKKQLQIIIQDTGVGIPEEIKSKIFDPFFTTKPVGEGTGLGLSVAYKFIKNHNGTIEVDSEPGQGTKFTILLPIEQI